MFCYQLGRGAEHFFTYCENFGEVALAMEVIWQSSAVWKKPCQLPLLPPWSCCSQNQPLLSHVVIVVVVVSIGQFDNMLVKILLAAAFVSFLLMYFNGQGSHVNNEGILAYVEPIVILIILILNAIVESCSQSPKHPTRQTCPTKTSWSRQSAASSLPLPPSQDLHLSSSILQTAC